MLKEGFFFGPDFFHFGPKWFDARVFVLWTREVVRLKDNQLKNIFVIYHDAIRRIENFLEAHDDEFFKNFMVKNKLKSAVFHAFTAGLS